jgi:DNA-binding transcriptional MerR regulator
MTIGQLARQAGLRASAVRYYERLGLLHAAHAGRFRSARCQTTRRRRLRCQATQIHRMAAGPLRNIAP